MKFSEYRIRQFVNLVRTTADTTLLIQRIAENRFFIQCCAAVVKPGDQKDAVLNELGRVLEKTAGQHLFSYKEIQDKLAPVGIALGLHRPDSGSIQTDYYRILDIPLSATDQEIKAAYRQKARAYHPDTGTGENDCFVRVQQAYEVLSSQSLRRQYDLSRSTAENWTWQESPDVQLSKQTGGKSWRRLAVPLIGIILFLAAIAFIVDAINQDLALTRNISAYTPDRTRPASNPDSSYRPSERNPPAKQAPSDGPFETNGPPNRAETIMNTDIQDGTEAFGQMSDVAENDVLPVSSPDKNGDGDQSVPAISHDKMESSINNPDNMTAKKPGLKKAALPHIKQTDNIPTIEAKVSKNQNISDPPPPPSRESAPADETMATADGGHRDMAQRLVDFLHAYCRTYENRNFDRFIFFFTDYAEENGVLFKSLLPTYRKNFQTLENVTYRIDMNNYLWDLDRNTVRVEGDFMLSWKKKQETVFHDFNGTIRMDLILFKDTFLVENLSYRFER